VRVFISSPGDLFPERDVVKQVVEQLNRSPRYLNRYKLIPYAYEDSTPALVGSEPQAVVDKYLLRPEAADIFVGMLWIRMGAPMHHCAAAPSTPTAGAPSLATASATCTGCGSRMFERGTAEWRKKRKR
jgi:hypothetical protein